MMGETEQNIIKADWFVGSRENYALLSDMLNGHVKRPKGF
jgi:hypothetical protein